MTTAAVVLAAGAGARFAGDGSKLVASVRGRPVVAWAVEAAVTAGCDETVVVVGADADVVIDALPAGVTVIVNEAWSGGLATSLAGALDYAGRAGHDAVVVGLGDQPFVGPDAWIAVAGADGAVAVATYDGARRNPVRLDRSVWPLLPVEGDDGARTLMRSRPDLVQEVPCTGDPTDVDTAEDLTRWS